MICMIQYHHHERQKIIRRQQQQVQQHRNHNLKEKSSPRTSPQTTTAISMISTKSSSPFQHTIIPSRLKTMNHQSIDSKSDHSINYNDHLIKNSDDSRQENYHDSEHSLQLDDAIDYNSVVNDDDHDHDHDHEDDGRLLSNNHNDETSENFDHDDNINDKASLTTTKRATNRSLLSSHLKKHGKRCNLHDSIEDLASTLAFMNFGDLVERQMQQQQQQKSSTSTNINKNQQQQQQQQS
jgi:hypothetical protein